MVKKLMIKESKEMIIKFINNWFENERNFGIQICLNFEVSH
jgi:hypothetical protein